MLRYDTATTSNVKAAIYNSERTSTTTDASKENTIDEPQKQSGGTPRIDLSRLPIKTSFQRVALEDENDRNETMNKDEIDALRKSVLQCNRPLNPWYERTSYAKSSPKIDHTAAKKAENTPPKIKVIERRPSSSTNGGHIESHKSANAKAPLESKPPNNGASLKKQLFDQQQQRRTPRNTDLDMSNAIASEIKLLEQLEIEHLKRANDLTICHLESSSKSDDSDTREHHSPASYRNGHTMAYDCKRDNRVNEEINNSNIIKQKVTPIRDNHKPTRRNDTYNDDQFYARDKIKHKNYYTSAYRRPYKCVSELPSPLTQPSVCSDDDSFNLHMRSYPYILDERRDSPRVSLPACYSCGERINDVILQALGASYHARCFRCVKCNQCLDGIPFAVDTMGKVFCMDDYEMMFIPACVACRKPISAINEFGQIIRIVFQNQEYHIECFNCEGCGLQLSNEQPNRCYPLSSHLLCRNCHVQWKLLGGVDAPITDL